MKEWVVAISVSPYFPSSENRAKVGSPIQKFTVNGKTFEDAIEKAKSIRMGIQSNPSVWMTDIMGVVRKDIDIQSEEKK